MVIRTRPSSTIVGSGPFLLALTDDQLALIATLIGLVRLGHGHQYREAALELNNLIEMVTGDVEYMQDAYETVDPKITIETDTIIETYDGAFCTIEV